MLAAHFLDLVHQPIVHVNEPKDPFELNVPSNVSVQVQIVKCRLPMLFEVFRVVVDPGPFPQRSVQIAPGDVLDYVDVTRDFLLPVVVASQHLFPMLPVFLILLGWLSAMRLFSLSR